MTTSDLASLRGRYINLDASPERRASIEQALARTGLSDRVTRFAALQGDGRKAGISQGELGCLLSHAALIAQAAETGEALLILEDDAVPARNFLPWLGRALAMAGSDWDLLFLSQNGEFIVPSRLREALRRKRSLGDIHRDDFDAFSLLGARRHYVSGCMAYVVSPRGAVRLDRALRAVALADYPRPIDMVMRALIHEGRLRAAVLFPYIVGVGAGLGSTIGARVSAPPGGHALIEGMNAAVNLLVAGEAPQGLFGQADRASRGPVDRDAFVLSQAFYRYLSER